MTKLNGWKIGVVLFVGWVATAVSPAQVFTTLADFEGTNGSNPWFMSLVQGRNGYFYGTTIDAVFRVNPSDGALNSAVGDGSYNGVVLSQDGDFYAVLDEAFYRISPKGVETYLCGIPSSFIYGGLLQASDGSFYGTSYGGGNVGDMCETSCGFVFKITAPCQFETLYSFSGLDGANPYSTVIEAPDGSLYGTAAFGGSAGCGTVFKLTRLGTLTTLHDFSGVNDGCRPLAGLVQASDGNFYGTTYYGFSAGSVFRITPTGVVTSFPANNDIGGEPYGGALIQATDGNFYGNFSTGGIYGWGSVFQMTPDGVITAMHSFDKVDGWDADGGLVQGTDGKIYGATLKGGDLSCGAPDGCGTIFSLDMGLGSLVTFVRPAGKVGHVTEILGQGFTGTTSVMLNGVPANFTVVSDTFIKATVPSGATTGYVTVTTPTGVLTSNVPFHVIQ